MSISLSRRTAQKIVDTVKSVCGQDINFINTDGIIFASTNPSRIGSFHEIGKKVITTGETIEVTTDDSFYGTQKGVNLPFIYNWDIIAVIGISGEPDTVRQYAVLAEKITRLILREHEIDSHNYSKKSQMNYIIKAIVENTGIKQDYLTDFLSQHNMNLDTVCRTILFRLNPRYNLSNLSMIESSIYQIFSHISAEIYTFNFPNDYILILPEEQYQRWAYIFTTFAENNKELIRIGIGISCLFLQQTDSYSSAQIALQSLSGSENIASFDHLDLEVLFGCITPQAREKYLQKTIANLLPEQIHLLRTYFSTNLSLKATSDLLFLHKNTLQYKLNQINKQTGYNPRVFRDAVILYLATALHPE